MWDTLFTIYGGETNILRDKFESFRENFDKMRMEEGETIAQYCDRVKA